MALVKFSDVAHRVDTKENRFDTALEYYVGGEHIETDELVVSGRGIIKGSTIGPMFECGFKAGDILFVTRNPHLRKSAMVMFDGICSQKTFVVATKNEDKLLQKFLALEMRSDRFWDYCEENKSGSVNYFINWSTLADYEFDLPPIEKQRELVDKLWAMNDLKESYRRLYAATDEMLKAKFREMFGQCDRLMKWRDAIAITNGKAHKEDYLDEGPYPICGSGGLMGYTNKSMCKKGSIILGRKGNINNPILMGTDYWIVDTAFSLCPNPDVLLPEYTYFWCSEYDFSILNKQGVLPSLTKSDLLEIEIPIPPIEEQHLFQKIYDSAESTKSGLKKSIAGVESMMRALINGEE